MFETLPGASPTRSSSREPRGRREGKTSGSAIRMGVLLLILIGTAVFGWFQRPDLFRRYLAMDAPARSEVQSLEFANDELFELATNLAKARVVLRGQGQDTLAAMIENGNAGSLLSEQAMEDTPQIVAAGMTKDLARIRLDVDRSLELLQPKSFRSNSDQNVLWKTLDLAMQVVTSIKSLDGTSLGEALMSEDAPASGEAVVDTLREIQRKTAPRARNSDADPTVDTSDFPTEPGSN
ncbi:MAG: hypothetical protein CMJ23_03545 [Phycisphaerae bacterium]|nr:hypothetical protein [Phycisphaerae bacterium]